jgi:hypothetical protein
MHTNAPDRGRDLSVERASSDSLSGTRNQRVIIQSKHWLTKSVRPQDVSEALTEIALWEPPRINVLVMAVSGRFTADAVSWVEKHNDSGRQPAVEMWAESHLEMLERGRPVDLLRENRSSRPGQRRHVHRGTAEARDQGRRTT